MKNVWYAHQLDDIKVRLFRRLIWSFKDFWKIIQAPSIRCALSVNTIDFTVMVLIKSNQVCAIRNGKIRCTSSKRSIFPHNLNLVESTDALQPSQILSF